MSIFVDIEKRLGSFHLRVKFEAENEVLALLGASGCGKSMTLKCIAGIEKPDRGKIIVDGVTLFDSEKNINLTPQKRRVGLLFQNYALFPNMTVMQNILAGANREKDSAKKKARVNEIMETFGLTELADHYPAQLSGGQQQRTALARILVSEPNILLLDEPFSALDSHLRFRLEQEVREVIRKFGKTVLLVSHDRDEVFRLSDSIAIINNGMVDAFGKKDIIFADPQTRMAAMLTGCKNISPIEILDDSHVKALDWGITLKVHGNLQNISYVGIRMHDICEGIGENTFTCNVIEEIENPFSYTIMLNADAAENASQIGWEMDKSDWLRLRATQVTLHLPPEKIILLKGNTHG